MDVLPKSTIGGRGIVARARYARFRGESRNVAEFPDRIAKEPDLGRLNFHPFKIKDLTGETTSHYEVDPRGCTIPAMGFTGEKALKWKLRNIDAFEIMKAELRNRPTIDPTKVLNDQRPIDNGGQP